MYNVEETHQTRHYVLINNTYTNFSTCFKLIRFHETNFELDNKFKLKKEVYTSEELSQNTKKQKPQIVTK